MVATRLQTRTARLSRAINAFADWCRRHRHLPVKEQHAALTSRLRGHFNYFGVNGNSRSLTIVGRRVVRSWFKWINRRSQRASKTWDEFNDLLRDFPLPRPTIRVQIWSS